MPSFNSLLAKVTLTSFLVSFSPVLAINERDINTVNTNNDFPPPQYSSIHLNPANWEHDNCSYQIRTGSLDTILAPAKRVSLSLMDNDEWDVFKNTWETVYWACLSQKTYKSARFKAWVSNFTNKALQEKILVRLAERSLHIYTDNDYSKEIIKMMLQAHWPFESVINIFIEHYDVEMLLWCLHLGWRFGDTYSEFLNQLFRTNPLWYSHYRLIPLCWKILELQNVNSGIKDAVFAFVMNVKDPKKFKNPTFSKFIVNLFNPKQKYLFFVRYLNCEGYEYAVDYLMDQLSPEYKTSDILLLLIRNKSFDLAAQLVEKGWPLDKLKEADLDLIRRRGHSRIVHAFQGIRSLF